MPVGRKPKPMALKLLDGNPGNRPIDQDIPQPAALVDLKPPAGLDTYGRQAWKRNAPVLKQLGILTESDVDMLAAYCMAYSRWRHGLKTLAPIDPISEAYRPVAMTVEKAEQAMRLIASEFGMTPTSRERIKSSKPIEEEDPMMRHLYGGRSSS